MFRPVESLHGGQQCCRDLLEPPVKLGDHSSQCYADHGDQCCCYFPHPLQLLDLSNSPISYVINSHSYSNIPQGHLSKVCIDLTFILDSGSDAHKFLFSLIYVYVSVFFVFFAQVIITVSNRMTGCRSLLPGPYSFILLISQALYTCNVPIWHTDFLSSDYPSSHSYHLITFIDLYPSFTASGLQ